MSHQADPPSVACAVTFDTDFPVGPSRAIWVGTAGDLSVRMYLNAAAGQATDITFPNVPVGWFSCQATRVLAAGTAMAAAQLKAGK